MVTWGFSSCHVEMTVFQGRKLLPMSILSSEVHQLFWQFEATRKHESFKFISVVYLLLRFYDL